MKIKSFSAEQFAGIRNKNISFTDGMNVVLGNNEAGKSTVITAIYNALTKPRKIDKRKDPDFLQTMFPSGGMNNIDVTVAFNDKDSEYTIEREWYKENKEENNIKLTDINHDILKKDAAEKKLKEILEYGTNVYDNLIFGRQNNEKNILNWCYSFFKADKDTASARMKISEVLSAVGDISPDKICSVLNEKIEKMDKHWDFENNAPKFTQNNTIREKGGGTIHNLYKDYYTARKKYKEVEDLIEAIGENKKKIEKNEKELEKYKNLSDVISLKERIENYQNSLNDANDADKKWNKFEEDLNTAKKLSDQKTNNTLIKIKKAIDFTEKYSKIDSDFKRAEGLSENIEKNNMILTSRGMKASVKLDNGYKAVISGADGIEKEISISGKFSTNGFVNLVIPGVANITVSPENVDVEELKNNISKDNDELTKLLDKYNYKNFKDLKTLKENINNSQRKADNMISSLSELLNEDVNSIKERANKITIDDKFDNYDNIEENIKNFLNENSSTSLDKFIGEKSAVIDSYINKYEDKNNLKNIISNLNGEIKKIKLPDSEEIPDLTKDQYDEKLKKINNTINDLFVKKGELSTKEQEDISELKEAVKDAENKWRNELHICKCYKQILEDFENLKKDADNGFEEFYSHFNKYLTMITDNSLSLEQGDKNLILESGNNKIDSSKLLSEGTKKTLLLAFRLAVLDYFYPNGGGFIVLDDDLLDMDPNRRKRSSELLNAFAEKNQVIFTTCDPAIADLLGGNRINI